MPLAITSSGRKVIKATRYRKVRIGFSCPEESTPVDSVSFAHSSLRLSSSSSGIVLVPRKITTISAVVSGSWLPSEYLTPRLAKSIPHHLILVFQPIISLSALASTSYNSLAVVHVLTAYLLSLGPWRYKGGSARALAMERLAVHCQGHTSLKPALDLSPELLLWAFLRPHPLLISAHPSLLG